MILKFLASTIAAKVVNKEIEKRGGLEKIANDVACVVKSEVDKRGKTKKIMADGVESSVDK